ALDMSSGVAKDDALGFGLDLAGREKVSNMRLPTDHRVRIGVRPEDVKLVTSGGIRGTIYGAEHHGVEIIAIIQVGPHTLRATIPADSKVAVNQAIEFSFAQSKLHFFDPLSGESLIQPQAH
ncbi:MAG: TOBE domain-containing protein, partial [Telluria sp.]